MADEEKTIYIAGQITDNVHFMQDFETAEKKLKARGYTKIINPTCLSNLKLDYEQFMIITLSMVEAADVIYLLRNWKNSKGAAREYQYALVQDKDIMFEADEDYKDFD